MANFDFINALVGQPTTRTPVWLMRQAGRYLPEYRALREKAGSFMNLCQNPEMAAEVTLQPFARFDLDAAIIFSDILTVPDAMGLGLYFVAGEGPQFERPVQTAEAVAALPVIDAAPLRYVMDAITTTKAALQGRAPLIGFCGSPWTVGTYMVEGRSSKNFATIKQMLYQSPTLMHTVLDKVTQSTIAYVRAQVDAGADAIMVFDSWGGALSRPAYETFSLHYMQQIVDALRSTHPHTPIILFTKGGGAWLEQLVETGCNGLGLDWTVDIDKAFKRTGGQVALQGNLDPTILTAGPEATVKEATRILQQAKGNPRHIFNLGHGILPTTPIESVTALIETVHQGV